MQDAVAGRLRVGRPLSRRSEAALVRSAQGGVRARRSRSSSGATGRPSTARRGWSCTTRPRPRTSRRRRSCARCARWTASTGAGRSARGCTGSSSTARSTGRAPARCAPRPPPTRCPRPPRPTAAPSIGDEHRRRARRPRARAPRRRRPAPPARLHAGRDRGDARPPARHRQLAPAPRARRARRSRWRRSDDARRVDALERALREAEPPDAGRPRASGRGGPCSPRTRRRAPRRRVRRAAPLVWAALAATLAALVVTQRDSGPAQAVERLVRDIVARARGPRRPRSAASQLPAQRAAARQRRRRPVRRRRRSGKRTRLGR